MTCAITIKSISGPLSINVSYFMVVPFDSQIIVSRWVLIVPKYLSCIKAA